MPVVNLTFLEIMPCSGTSSTGFNPFTRESMFFSNSFSSPNMFLESELYQTTEPSSSNHQGSGKFSNVSLERFQY